MSSYTMEDIELIRSRSGISYQEAVALLDYHNGNVARALIDLERNGKLKKEPERSQVEDTRAESGGRKVMNFLQRLFRIRLKVHKGQVPILNVSVLFGIVAVILSPRLAVISLVLALILGYHLSIDRGDADFAGANLERMVRDAAQNAKNAVNDMARGFSDAQRTQTTAESAKEPVDSRSYYQSGATSARPSRERSPEMDVPTIQMPVKVESQDGSVSIEREADGFSSATIE